jgi:hypothetical protein
MIELLSHLETRPLPIIIRGYWFGVNGCDRVIT